MPEPMTSDNVLIEDLTDVKDHTFGIREDKNFDITQNNTFKICRGRAGYLWHTFSMSIVFKLQGKNKSLGYCY